MELILYVEKVSRRNVERQELAMKASTLGDVFVLYTVLD